VPRAAADRGGDGGVEARRYGEPMLDDYRIIELGIWVAGPAAGGILADWGADVIKIEAPAGDPMRRVFNLIVGHGAPESPPFDLDNRGKRSVVVDLGTEEGRAVVLRLVADADVFLTNLRPEAVERLGLGPSALMDANPRLVYASVTGYGLEGPDAHRAGYDVGGFWARTGVAATLTPEGAGPPAIRGGFGDHITGITTLAGILAALLEREKTGRGQLVETSLLRTGIYCLGWDLGIQARYDKLVGVLTRDIEINPMVNSYEAGDGLWFWLLGVESDRAFPKVCAAIDRLDLLDDERFADARGRRKNATVVITTLDEEFAKHTRAELVERFDGHDVWWAPVNTPADVLVDPQAVAAGAFVDVPEGAGAPAHRAVASPVTFRDASGDPAGAPPIEPVPGLGEHTDAVLADLGFTDAEITALREAGAVI
jgi:crotonobetainyl-CoA:carnitine CoA-transferase CaiB-like acyl-CoA transferase